jgi:hypothetical protein
MTAISTFAGTDASKPDRCMRTLLAGLIAVTSLAAVRPADAQPPAAARTASYSEIIALLQSDRPADQAWGARLAGRSIWTETAPLIERIIFRRSSGPSAEDAFCIEAAIDGLIELGVTPSTDLLKAAHERWPTETLILAARLKGYGDGRSADDVLFSLLSRSRGLVWFGAANLLLRHPPPGFIPALLNDLGLAGTIFISETGGEAGGGGSVSVGDGIQVVERPPDFPPAARYNLVAAGSADVRVVAEGPVSVYRTRTEARGGQMPLPSSDRPVTNRDRLKYAASAGGLERTPLTGGELLTVTWRGDAALEADKRSLRADILRRSREFIEQLQTAGALSAAEAAALPLPPVEIVVHDMRRPVR